MAFDGIVARCIKWELEGIAIGGRVSRVFQPERDEIVLAVRNNSVNFRLLISANPGNSRIGITNVSKENPMEAPSFCMALRKHLIGGELKAIEQVDCDRIIKLVFKTTNEMGDPVTRTLVCEIMGRYSNIVLLNENGVIIDCIKRVDERTSSYREVMPARVYMLPPPQNRILPQSEEAFDKFKEAFSEAIANGETAGTSVSQFLQKSFSGFSKRVAEALSRRAGIDPSEKICTVGADREVADSLFKAIEETLLDIKEDRYTPAIFTDGEGMYNDFHVLPVCAEGRFLSFSSASGCIDEFFKGKDEILHRKNATLELSKALKTAFERTERRLRVYENDIEESADYEDYKVKGELLAANLYALSGGEKEIKVVNYYDEELPEIVLPLDPHLSPAKNLSSYFRIYKKKKGRAENALKGKIATEKELEYLSTVRYALENVEGGESVSEIRDELIEGGYYKPRKEKGKRRPPSVKKNNFEELSTRDGVPVWAGRNNVQNDLITTKLAAPNDMWFHVKNHPGAHVILRLSLTGGAFTAGQLLDAAKIAAERSGFKSKGPCEVDYTRVRHVKKQSGARPGMVTYTDYKTIIVNIE